MSDVRAVPEVTISDGPSWVPGGCHDVVVVIDVIRAFTTASLLLRGGAVEIVCARGVRDACRLAGNDIVVGETATSEPLRGVLPNSPGHLVNQDVVNQRIVLFTQNGTPALIGAPRCRTLLAAATVNAGATARWILNTTQARSVRLVPSDPGSREDLACARYLAGLLTGASVDPAETSREVQASVRDHWNRWGPLVPAATWRQFEADVEFCAQVDTFPVAIRADRDIKRRPVLRAVPSDRPRDQNA